MFSREIFFLAMVAVLTVFLMLLTLKEFISRPSLKEQFEPPVAKLALKEYFIKSAYDAAYDGTKCNLEELKRNINNGCRFLHLHVALGSKTNAMYVIASHRKENQLFLETHLPLSDVMTYLFTNAFTPDSKAKENTSTLYNQFGKYPLFLYFTFESPLSKSMKTATCLLSSLYRSHLETQSNRWYRSSNGKALSINAATSLADIQDKILILLDDNNFLNAHSATNSYSDLSMECRMALQGCVNLIMGAENAMLYSSHEEVLQSTNVPLRIENVDELTTNTSTLSISLPGEQLGDYVALLIYHKMQICLYPQWQSSFANVKEYNQLFEDLRTPMPMLAQILRFLPRKPKAKQLRIFNLF